MRSNEAIQADQSAIDAFCINCMGDYEYFATTCLKIKTKTEGLQPLIFNKAQKHLNDIVEKSVERWGKVRCIVVKGRQQGLSTWIEGRGYWKTIHNPETRS